MLLAYIKIKGFSMPVKNIIEKNYLKTDRKITVKKVFLACCSKYAKCLDKI